MNHIVQQENPILRDVAMPVPISDIGSDKIKQIITDMQLAMHTEKDGIAIAAPQIGNALRIFVVSGARLNQVDPKNSKDQKDLVFINPEIIRFSREKKAMEEGCLSVRWIYGMVKRATKVTIKAYDENGKLFERGAGGILAQIFQHEMDHLEGILFTDIAEETWELSQKEIDAIKSENQKKL